MQIKTLGQRAATRWSSYHNNLTGKLFSKIVCASSVLDLVLRKSKAGSRLRQLKIHHQRELRQLREGVSAQLFAFERKLHQQFYSQLFYSDAMMNLLTSEDEPDSDTLIGAIVTRRWLQQRGNSLTQQLLGIQQWVNRH